MPSGRAAGAGTIRGRAGTVAGVGTIHGWAGIIPGGAGTAKAGTTTAGSTDSWTLRMYLPTIF